MQLQPTYYSFVWWFDRRDYKSVDYGNRMKLCHSRFFYGILGFDINLKRKHEQINAAASSTDMEAFIE